MTTECAGSRTLNLDAMCGLSFAPRGPAYTLARLLQGMSSHNLHIRVFAPITRVSPDEFGMKIITGGLGIPMLDRRLPFRAIEGPLRARAEAKLLRGRGASPDRVVFTWGNVTLPTSWEMHRRGTKVVREKFNCAIRVARDLITDAYAELGSPNLNSVHAEYMEKEEEELSIADAIFSPSPMVAQSLKAIGIDEARIIPTSYGWEPERFLDATRVLEPTEGPTLVFVGYVCVRKGAHTLLQAWERARIKGRLVLVGKIEPIIAEKFAHILARPDVLHVPFTPRVGDYFRSADWFVFPTLEEGGPQVVYEAAGCGVPFLVTPMGAGAFGRDGIEGHVLDSRDPGDWARLIESLPDREDEREVMSRAAQARAQEFTYPLVGARRGAALLQRFGS